MKNTSTPALPPVALKIFETLPICCLVLSKDLTILTASDDHVELTGKTREEITGRYIFDVFPERPEWSEGKDGGIAASLQRVLATRKPDQVPLTRFDFPDPENVGKLKESYWVTKHKPVLNEEGEISYIIHETRNVSGEVIVQNELTENLEKERKAKVSVDRLNRQMEMLFHSIPAQIAILSGSDFVYSYINPQYQKELFPEREVLGMPLLAALPEIAEQPIWHILNTVYATGQPHIDTEILVPLAREAGGSLHGHYFNVVYQPLRDESGIVNGVLSFKYEVTEHVAARKLLENRELELRQAYLQLQVRSEELLAGNEELEAINEELKQAQNELALLNEDLEARIRLRTSELQTSENELQAMNEELSATNEELSATNEELTESQRRLEDAVQSLAVSDQKIRSLVDSAPFPIGVYTGAEMRIEMLNQAIIKTWDRGSDLIGKTYAEVLPELEGTGVYETLDQVYQTGLPYKARHQRVELLVDGQLQPFYFNYDFTPLFDKKGNVYGVMNTAADVTDLVNARMQVEQSQKNLYNIIMRSPVSKSILLGADHVVEVANDQIIQLWGKSREEIMNKPIFESLPEAQGQGLEELLQDVYVNGNRIEARERPVTLLRNNQFEKLYLNFVYQPYRDAYENIIGVIVTAIDVTAQVNAREEVQQLNEELAATNEELLSANEVQSRINDDLAALNEALELSRSELKLAIEAAGLATWDYNPATGKFVGNDLTKAWFGLQPEEEIDLANAISAIAEADRDRVTQAIQRAMTYSSGGDYDIHYSIINSIDPTPRVVRAKGKALFDEQMNATRLSGVLLDVTEQKKDEERKNDFIGMVSHELKTPLTSLSAYVQMLLTKAKANEDSFTSGALTKVNHQVKRMSTMINSFLNVSRLESGKIQLEKKDFIINNLIEEIIDDTRLLISTHEITFTPCQPVLVNADVEKIGSVITNLLSNAIKYSPQGRLVEISCKLQENFVEVSVRDEGIGISPADQEKLFERYHRVENQNAKHISGFGIGLYLSAEIISRHNGHIGVTSEAGKGSTFWFKLPL